MDRVLRKPPVRPGPMGIPLPDSIAGLTRGEAKECGDAFIKGVAIPYQSEDAEVTVFIRGIAPKEINTAKEIVEDGLAAVRAMGELGRYSNVKILKTGEEETKNGWAVIDFTAKSGEMPMLSAIW